MIHFFIESFQLNHHFVIIVIFFHLLSKLIIFVNFYHLQTFDLQFFLNHIFFYLFYQSIYSFLFEVIQVFFSNHQLDLKLNFLISFLSPFDPYLPVFIFIKLLSILAFLLFFLFKIYIDFRDILFPNFILIFCPTTQKYFHHLTFFNLMLFLVYPTSPYYLFVIFLLHLNISS